MACVKTCKCGKEQKTFKLLRDDQIETFMCPACPVEDESEVPKSTEAKPIMEEASKPRARRASNKAPEKAEQSQE